MTDDQNTVELSAWLDRARRMAGYRAEATDFIRRVGSMLPAVESDVALVCRLWTVADEHDALVCDALTKFDEALFDSRGEIEITRGAEPRSMPDDDERLFYVCAWSVSRPDGRATGVTLAADRVTGRLAFEVREPTGRIAPVASPADGAADLYEALANAFFALHDPSSPDVTD